MADTPVIDFAELLRNNVARLMKERRVSKPELAKQMGRSRQWAYLFLNGTASVPVGELGRILAALGGGTAYDLFAPVSGSVTARSAQWASQATTGAPSNATSSRNLESDRERILEELRTLGQRIADLAASIGPSEPATLTTRQPQTRTRAVSPRSNRKVSA